MESMKTTKRRNYKCTENIQPDISSVGFVSIWIVRWFVLLSTATYVCDELPFAWYDALKFFTWIKKEELALLLPCSTFARGRHSLMNCHRLPLTLVFLLFYFCYCRCSLLLSFFLFQFYWKGHVLIYSYFLVLLCLISKKGQWEMKLSHDASALLSCKLSELYSWPVDHVIIALLTKKFGDITALVSGRLLHP